MVETDPIRHNNSLIDDENEAHDVPAGLEGVVWVPNVPALVVFVHGLLDVVIGQLFKEVGVVIFVFELFFLPLFLFAVSAVIGVAVVRGVEGLVAAVLLHGTLEDGNVLIVKAELFYY
jgi:hypothetical protein